MEVFFQSMMVDADPGRSHPVEQNHMNDLQCILNSFDVITYGKAACLLRMIAAAPSFGAKGFLRSVGRLVAQAPYQTMTRHELLAAVSAEAAEGLASHDWCVGLSLTAFFDVWLGRSGLPKVTVCLRSCTQLQLVQRPFVIRRVDETDEELAPWPIPLQVQLLVKCRSGKSLDIQERVVFFEKKEVCIEVPDGTVAILVNPACTAYVHVSYDEDAWGLALHALEIDALDELQALAFVLQCMMSTQDADLGMDEGLRSRARLQRVSQLLESRRPDSTACRVAFEFVVESELRCVRAMDSMSNYDARAELEAILLRCAAQVQARLKWVRERCRTDERFQEGLDILQHFDRLALGLLDHLRSVDTAQLVEPEQELPGGEVRFAADAQAPMNARSQSGQMGPPRPHDGARDP